MAAAPIASAARIYHAAAGRAAMPSMAVAADSTDRTRVLRVAAALRVWERAAVEVVAEAVVAAGEGEAGT